MRLNQKPGIYILTIKSPNKTYKYVGQSVNISKRVYAHKNSLKKNIHHNTYIQNVYNKYCSSVNDITITYINYEEQYLNTMEQTWINIIQTNTVFFCLNNKPGKACRGYRLDEEHKRKISKSLKNSIKAQEAIQKCIKIRMETYIGKTEAQLKASRAAVKKMHTPEARAKSLVSRLNSTKFKEARRKAGLNLIGNKFALGKTDKAKNGMADKTIYVFQNKKTEEIFVGTRYELGDLINKTSYSLSNLITGKEKSAFGFILLSCPLSK